MDYHARTVDGQLVDLMAGLPAVSIEGAKGVGKTATARRLVTDWVALDRDRTRQVVAADPEIVLARPTPLLIDEWQLVPSVWDVVRRAVDEDRTAGRFLLTGSALPPAQARIHSGAGRIVRLMMRPMTLPERHVCTPTVSLDQLLSGSRGPIAGRCQLRLADYTEEIIASGFPGIRQDPPSYRKDTLASYLDEAVERDIPELGEAIRRPHALKAWLTAYAAASATTTAYTQILDSATAGEPNKPARNTVAGYRELLKRMWILDPLEAWTPVLNPLKRLAQAPKHHLVDPALAASLVGATTDSLLRADGPHDTRPEGTLLAALFESLAVMTVRVLAQSADARVFHLRTQGGEHEVDIIVERPDHKVLAIEVKLSAAPGPSASKHLSWLEHLIGADLLDKAIITTGEFAFRQKDGTAIIPLGLLGAHEPAASRANLQHCGASDAKRLRIPSSPSETVPS